MNPHDPTKQKNRSAVVVDYNSNKDPVQMILHNIEGNAYVEISLDKFSDLLEKYHQDTLHSLIDEIRELQKPTDTWGEEVYKAACNLNEIYKRVYG